MRAKSREIIHGLLKKVNRGENEVCNYKKG